MCPLAAARSVIVTSICCVRCSRHAKCPLVTARSAAAASVCCVRCSRSLRVESPYLISEIAFIRCVKRSSVSSMSLRVAGDGRGSAGVVS